MEIGEGSCVQLQLGQLHRLEVSASTQMAWDQKGKLACFQIEHFRMEKLQALQKASGLKVLLQMAQGHFEENIVPKHC